MATNVAAACSSLGLLGKSEKKHRLKSRFQVIRKLGQGTYGKVQLAINNPTQQEASDFYLFMVLCEARTGKISSSIVNFQATSFDAADC